MVSFEFLNFLLKIILRRREKSNDQLRKFYLSQEGLRLIFSCKYKRIRFRSESDMEITQSSLGEQIQQRSYLELLILSLRICEYLSVLMIIIIMSSQNQQYEAKPKLKSVVSNRVTPQIRQQNHLNHLYSILADGYLQMPDNDQLMRFHNQKVQQFLILFTYLFKFIQKISSSQSLNHQLLICYNVFFNSLLLQYSILIFKIVHKMDRSQQIINALKNNFTEQHWNQLLNQLSSRGNQIAAMQNNANNSHSISSYIRLENIKSQEGWFIKLNGLIHLLYEGKRELLIVLYRSLPVLLQKYVQINYVKYEGLEECIIKIYNYEYKSYNYAQVEKTELSKDVAIRNLYQSHLNKEMQQPNVEPLQQIIEINNTSRNTMKTLLFYLIYREAGRLGEQSLYDYYRALFIYCGGDEKDINRTGSLYLLERTNKVSIFKYSISEQELEWIILTLYELCTQVKKDKFELLAVINAIHKKASNESMFRISDVASSLIHLLQDQYSDIFI